ncbi:MAG: hypothetical protein NVSMB21_08550 [Vulcanimicrobiaceae bacterium]
MDRRIALAAALGAAAATPLAGPARAAEADYYTPPKLEKQGSSATAVAGPGTVVVKVLVAKDGSAKVQGVIRSTNHGDDAAALEIARTSTYRAASRGATAQVAFYDFTLRFTGHGARTSGPAEASASSLATYERQLRAGNYAGARTGLTAYVAAHPGDVKAELDLGVAAAYLGDASAAATAFGKAGSIPEPYKTLAAKAYNDAATDAFKKKEFDVAIAAAKHAVELVPGPFQYNTLGTAEDAAGDHAAAIADLEKARGLAASDARLGAADRAHIDVNLVAAYLGAGKPELAKTIADEIAKLDPSQSGATTFFATYYAKNASDLVAAGKYAEGAAAYEQAAAAAPSQAAAAYVGAAFAYLKMKPSPSNEKAKADADRALALEPSNAQANFAAGLALAQSGKPKDGLVYLNKADAAARAGTDANLTAAIESVIKQLGGAK